jgi:hypothetical protein
VIERLPAATMTPAAFARWREAGAPVVLTGAAALLDLPALADALGGRKLAARAYGDRLERPKAEWPGYCDFLPLTLGEYADLLARREAHARRIYLAQVPVGGAPAEQAAALGARLGLEAMSATNLWVGPAGHVEPLHYDPMDGVLMQLRGAKRVRLFAPEQSANLYPFPLLGGALRPWFAQVYLERPEDASFPRLGAALAAAVELDLGEGEALYIPAGWWHEVTALGEDYVVSVNRFQRVRPLRRLLGVRLGPALYAAFVLRRLLASWRGRPAGD